MYDPSDRMQIRSLELNTELGRFTLDLFTDRAPVTCGYFLDLAQAGYLDGASFFRIVTLENATHQASVPIEVMQGGLRDSDPQPIPPIKHESTQMTGLRHCKWTVSAARFDPGQTYGSFFVCMRDEPALDFGGARHLDGQGFAAFGQVKTGQDVVLRVFRRSESAEMLQAPILINSVIAL